MADWRALVRSRLAELGLDPIDEIDIVEEIAQHVEDRYEYLRSQGWPDADAVGLSLKEIESEAFDDLGASLKDD